MAVTAKPIFIQAVNVGLATIVPADTTAAKTIFTAGANGSRVSAITVHSTDTALRDVVLSLVRSATSYPLFTISVPINAGNTNAIGALDLLRSPLLPGLPYDAFGNRYIDLKSGDTLTINTTTTVTAAKQITAAALGGDL